MNLGIESKKAQINHENKCNDIFNYFTKTNRAKTVKYICSKYGYTICSASKLLNEILLK